MQPFPEVERGSKGEKFWSELSSTPIISVCEMRRLWLDKSEPSLLAVDWPPKILSCYKKTNYIFIPLL